MELSISTQLMSAVQDGWNDHNKFIGKHRNPGIRTLQKAQSIGAHQCLRIQGQTDKSVEYK